jgi:hypothetical protein
MRALLIGLAALLICAPAQAGQLGGGVGYGWSELRLHSEGGDWTDHRGVVSTLSWHLTSTDDGFEGLSLFWQYSKDAESIQSFGAQYWQGGGTIEWYGGGGIEQWGEDYLGATEYLVQGCLGGRIKMAGAPLKLGIDGAFGTDPLRRVGASLALDFTEYVN